jgi:hypothetical protein
MPMLGAYLVFLFAASFAAAAAITLFHAVDRFDSSKPDA